MRALSFSLLVVTMLGCASASVPRFSLREPVLRADDDRPLARALPTNEESQTANALDVIALRPMSHAFRFEQSREAVDVNSLDEVPDSTWFTNRAVSPDDLARGPCPDNGPLSPFAVKHAKSAGTTPGMVVTDSRAHQYMMKLDDNGPRQPEITTAADAIVSRLYWAIGFNAPCNDVVELRANEFHVLPDAYKKLAWGEQLPFGAKELAEFLALATHGREGTLRMSANRWIDGDDAGTWRTEGVRADDPNDRIAHEDRRELRGERLLAAWVAHWDSRGPNTFDAFVHDANNRGHLLHYFNDFNDSLGANPIRTPYAEPRIGLVTVANVPLVVEDLLGFGLIRRRWDEVRVDPQLPDLGYFDVEHFDPLAFSPQTPLVRWARADDSDLGWIARRIARMSPAHIRVAVHAGMLTRPWEEEALTRVLIGRREKILRVAFARSSPLADVIVEAGHRVCARDLGLATGASSFVDVSYGAVLREGIALTQRPPPAITASTDARVCVELSHFASSATADDSAERYATLDFVRFDAGNRTTLRAHFYDLGAERGFVLVGIERRTS